MASSIEPEFNPPDQLSRDEVIKLARHYINYWQIEAASWQYKWQWMCDEHDRQTHSVKSLLQMRWQCPESAPRDGSKILAIDENGEAQICWYDGNFNTRNSFTTGHYNEFIITYWMPIPHNPSHNDPTRPTTTTKRTNPTTD